VLTRSKGPLLALIAACLIIPICAPSRGRILLALLLLGGAIMAVCLSPEFLLRGGLSYRPDLLLGAWERFLQHPWLGLGVGTSYELEVAAIGATFEHAHNLFAHLALQLGLPGLVLWLSTLLVVLWRGWSSRASAAGLALCGLLGFSVVALMTDGIGPWVKPREEWFTVWLPIFLCLALFAGGADERSSPT
jgi:O-antigen ligase